MFKNAGIMLCVNFYGEVVLEYCEKWLVAAVIGLLPGVVKGNLCKSVAIISQGAEGTR